MSELESGNEDKTPKAALPTSVSEGNWLFRKGEYAKAIESYRKTLCSRPEDRSCYVGISKCFLMMGSPEMALKEAENSLNGDKSYFEGLYQKAEALYYMGEFEFAKVFYHQGLKIRPEIQKFRVGVQKAQEAIENATGTPSCLKLENKGDLSFFQKDEEVRRKYPATAIEQMMVEQKPQTTIKRPKSQKEEKRVLGEFYDDKKYLEDLLKDKDLCKVVTKKGGSLQDVVEGSLSYLETCTKFRNNEMPIVEQKVVKSSQKDTRPKSSPSSERLQGFLKQLDEIESDLLCGSAKAALKKADAAMKTVQSWSPKDEQEKNECLEMLHRCIGNSHFDLGDMDKALDHGRKALELTKKCKLPRNMSRALDYIGRVHAQMGQFEQAIECQERRIPLVHDPVERTWMFNELGRWHLELNRFEEARKYGLRSVTAADHLGDVKWQMNSIVLLAQSEMKLENCEVSVSHFERGLSYAKQQDDDSAVNAIQEALDEAKQRTKQTEDVADKE